MTRYMKYSQPVILSGANFVPQGNNLSNRTRGKDKGTMSKQSCSKQSTSDNIRKQSKSKSKEKQVSIEVERLKHVHMLC